MTREDIGWGVGTAAALCLCALCVPLIPVLVVAGKWGGRDGE